MWCVSVYDLESSAMGRSKTALGLSYTRKQKVKKFLKNPAVELAYWLKDIKYK